jgi:hypothetical protein
MAVETRGMSLIDRKLATVNQFECASESDSNLHHRPAMRRNQSPEWMERHAPDREVQSTVVVPPTGQGPFTTREAGSPSNLAANARSAARLRLHRSRTQSCDSTK